jgi:hypothetical protein
MRRISLAAFTAGIALTGCIVEQQRSVRDEPAVSELPPPPAPPADARPAGPPEAYADVDEAPPAAGATVDEDVFYDRLSPYGYWTDVAPYGRVWVPTVAAGWRPYYYGRWVFTDWGWTFVSDDPWGWAAYHYGRWNFAVGVGWYWIPDTVWGPAWVDWRYGGGWVTWCPLGPRGVYFGYRHPAWVAVQEVHFTHPIAAYAAPPRVTAQYVQTARPLTGPAARPVRGSQFGPPVARISAATGQQIRPVPARQVVAQRPSAIVRSQPGVTQRAQPGVARAQPGPRARTGDPMRSPMSPRGAGGDAASRGSYAPRSGGAVGGGTRSGGGARPSGGGGGGARGGGGGGHSGGGGGHSGGGGHVSR